MAIHARVIGTAAADAAKTFAQRPSGAVQPDVGVGGGQAFRAGDLHHGAAEQVHLCDDSRVLRFQRGQGLHGAPAQAPLLCCFRHTRRVVLPLIAMPPLHVEATMAIDHRVAQHPIEPGEFVPGGYVRWVFEDFGVRDLQQVFGRLPIGHTRTHESQKPGAV